MPGLRTPGENLFPGCLWMFSGLLIVTVILLIYASHFQN